MKRKEEITAVEGVKSAEVKKPNDVLTIIRTSLILLIITGLTVLLLAVVNHYTEGPIAELKKSELDSAIALIFPDKEYSLVENAPLAEYAASLYAVTENGNEIGYCVSATPQGYGGSVEMLVGIGTDGRILGVKITSDSETKTKSAPVKDENYLKTYVSKAGPFEFGENGIDAVSRSTMTSTAVLNGVNAAVATVNDYIAQKGE